MDAVDVERVAAWWSAALGYHRRSERPPFIVLESPERDGQPKLVVQHVPVVNAGKSPVHLDLRVDDPDAEVERLGVLGARIEWIVEDTDRSSVGWTAMSDPWGTVFCVCSARTDP